MSYATDDSNLTTTTRITYEKNVTIDDVIKEANMIYAETRKRKIDFKNFEETDKYAVEMRRAHKQFAESYPVVLRYITQLGEYDEKALRLYLLKIQQHPWTDEESYLQSQADYVVMLYKAKHKRWNATQVSNLRQNVYADLKKEKEKFKSLAEKYQKEADADEEQYKLNRQRELADFLTIHIDEVRAGLQLDPRCETSIPIDDLPQVSLDSDNTPVAVASACVARADDLLA